MVIGGIGYQPVLWFLHGSPYIPQAMINEEFPIEEMMRSSSGFPQHECEWKSPSELRR